jgi:hypothetical protein
MNAKRCSYTEVLDDLGITCQAIARFHRTDHFPLACTIDMELRYRKKDDDTIHLDRDALANAAKKNGGPMATAARAALSKWAYDSSDVWNDRIKHAPLGMRHDFLTQGIASVAKDVFTKGSSECTPLQQHLQKARLELLR